MKTFFRGLCFVLGLWALFGAAHAQDNDLSWTRIDSSGAARIRLYFFWSASCPHCQEAKPFIEALPRRHDWITLESREVSRDADNARRLKVMTDALGQEAGVPAFFFCGEAHIGWHANDTTGADLEKALVDCHQRYLAGRAINRPADVQATRIALPWGRTLDAARLSLPVLTLLLAGLDAFNPCAFFVLLFVLSMMAHQKSRTHMLIVGGLFVACSGLMYFAFMAAWLNVFQLLGQLAGVTLAAGAVAVVVGTLNVKDFFAFKQGVSLSISESGRQDIFRRARAVLSAEHLPTMLGATALLAIAANFYELLCTAGFPLVYTRLLTLHETGLAARYGYLALYNLIYVLPLAAIVIVFARTLGAKKLDERQGRLLKLMSGLMMLELGILLLVAPERSADVALNLAMICAAVGTTAIAAQLTRKRA